jgi:hypothetical protein
MILNTIHKKLIYLVIVILSILASCKKDRSECSDNKYYMTFIGNGERVCYSNCIAYLNDNSKNDDNSKFQIDPNTIIIAGEIYSKYDSLWSDLKICIYFFGKTVGVYNNDSITELYSVGSSKTQNMSYMYPDLDSTGIRGNFELNIKEYNLEKKLISGSFNGLLYHYNQNDSLLISNGEFRGELKLGEY